MMPKILYIDIWYKCYRAAVRERSKQLAVFSVGLKFMVVCGLVLQSPLIGQTILQEPKEDKIVKMPEFIVSEESPVLPWVYASFPGFEVLSNCPAEVNRAAFENFAKAFDTSCSFLPASFQRQMSEPKILILDQRPLVAMDGRPLPTDRAVPEFVPLFGPDTDVFYYNVERAYHREIHGIVPKGAMLLSNSPSIDPHLASASAAAGFFVRQSILSMVYRSAPKIAPALGYGLSLEMRCSMPIVTKPWHVQTGGGGAESLGSDYANGAGDILISYWIPPADGVAVGIAGSENQHDVLRPILEVLSANTPPVDRGVYREWCFTSVVFTHFSLFGGDASRRNAFWKLVEESRIRGQVTEADIKRLYGTDPITLQKRLERYRIKFHQTERDSPGAAGYDCIHLEKYPSLASPQTRRATATETVRLLGEWERLMSRKYPKAPWLARAKKWIDKQVNLDPDALAIRGLISLDGGDAASAKADLEIAAASGSRRPLVWADLAHLRLLEVLKNTQPKGRLLTESEVAPIFECIRHAASLEPHLASVTDLFLETCSRADRFLTDADVALLCESVRGFPRDTRRTLGVISLLSSKGRQKEASAAAQRALPFASHGSEEFARLATFSEQRPEIETNLIK